MTQTMELLPLSQETTLLLYVIHSLSTSLIEAKLVHPQIFVGLSSHLLEHMMIQWPSACLSLSDTLVL